MDRVGIIVALAIAAGLLVVDRKAKPKPARGGDCGCHK